VENHVLKRGKYRCPEVAAEVSLKKKRFMKRIIATFVKKVLAIHPDDHVSNQEIGITLFAMLFIVLFISLVAKSLLIHGY
jgi:hypothetical protein